MQSCRSRVSSYTVSMVEVKLLIVPVMIESLLLLAWRHLLAYANQAVTGGTPVRPGDLASSLSFSSQVSQSGVGSLRGLATIAATLRGTLDGLEDAEVSEASWRKLTSGVYPARATEAR